jgi:hypothetical protein
VFRKYTISMDEHVLTMHHFAPFLPSEIGDAEVISRA